MTKIEGPLWRFRFRALVLLLYSSQKLFRAHRALHIVYISWPVLSSPSAQTVRSRPEAVARDRESHAVGGS